MKILYAASTFGHIRSFHVPYIKEMIARGHEVDIAGSGSAEGLPAGAGVIELDFEKKMQSPVNFKTAQRLTGLMKKSEYDLVIVHTSLAAFFVRLAVRKLPASERPYVINVVHGYLFDEKAPFLKRRILLTAEKIMASFTDRIIVMNEEDFGIAKKYRLCKSDSEIYKIAGFGYDSKRFRLSQIDDMAIDTDTDNYPQQFRLIYAAEFSSRKNQAFLLRVLKELETADPSIDYHLTLAGRGTKLESCKALAAELGIENKVEFPGFINNIEDFYSKSDLSISSSRSEGLPFNIMESLACGLPVVATKVKGHADLVHPGENGELYEYGDIAGCVAAIIKTRKGLADGTYTPQKITNGIEGYALDAVIESNLNLMLNR